MALKPHVMFDNLFPKLYNLELWLRAYQAIAPNPGNMTVGADGNTIDGASLELIQDLIGDLKASRLRLDARLFAPAPERAKVGRGRPRLVGARLPFLSKLAPDFSQNWQLVELDWYGGATKFMWILADTALWYSNSNTIQIRAARYL